MHYIAICCEYWKEPIYLKYRKTIEKAKQDAEEHVLTINNKDCIYRIEKGKLVGNCFRTETRRNVEKPDWLASIGTKKGKKIIWDDNISD